VHGPWEKRCHIKCGGRRGTRPAKRGGKRTVGIRRWRRLDVSRGWKAQGTGSAQQKTGLMHRVRILCVICALICYTPDSCNRELCLTLAVCFRRINHIAVKAIYIHPLMYEKLCRAHFHPQLTVPCNSNKNPANYHKKIMKHVLYVKNVFNCK
jgi:hypothetical protein